jgi:hypothetical protein
VAVVSPTATPEMIRAISNPIRLGAARKTSALSTLTSSADTSTRLRPIQSDT